MAMTTPDYNQISSLFQNLTLDDAVMKKNPNEDIDTILAYCKSLVEDYKNRECKIRKREFDTMVATIAGFFDAAPPCMSRLQVSLALLLDDLMSATYARLLEDEGKLVGCQWRGLLEALDGLPRRVIPAEVDGNGGAGRCYICTKNLAEIGVGSVVRVTDCGYSCHSMCLLQWHGENAYCPNFCGSHLHRGGITVDL